MPEYSPILVSPRVGSGEEADSPHSLRESVLKTIATMVLKTRTTVLLCLTLTTLCERSMPMNRQRSITRLKQVIHEDTVIDPPLKYMEFTWCNWEDVLGMHQSTFTPSDVSGPRLEIPYALLVHDNSPLIFSFVIFLITGCNVLFFSFIHLQVSSE